MTSRIRVLLGSLALVGVALATAPAGTATVPRAGAAPVTAPDAVQTFPGNLAALRPLRNDTDAEGDKLRICALGPERYDGIRRRVYDDQLDYYLNVRRTAAPGTYTFTYYACDGTSSTPGTITLTVEKQPRITVRKLAGHPGRLRVTNGASFPIRFVYGDYTKDDAEGDVRIAKKSSRVVSSRYTRIDWFAFVQTPAGSTDEVGRGHVQGIPQ
jgi:Big-like domain-containing protein